MDSLTYLPTGEKYQPGELYGLASDWLWSEMSHQFRTAGLIAMAILQLGFMLTDAIHDLARKEE